MTSDLSSSLDNILDSISDQTQSFTDSMISFVPSSQVEKSTQKQILNNKISQISVATCNATSENINSNSIVYVTGSAGDINVSQSGDAIASCTMNTLSKIQTFNSEQAQSTQDATRENVFVALFSSIGGIILIIGIILVLVLFMPQLLKTFTGSKATPAATENGGNGNGKSSSGLLSKFSKYAPQLEEGAEFLASNPELLFL
uniref:Lipid membrane protein n=1 Tax=Pithovirus LCPAC403 TaxID=2506596 RepID=A0A481ZBA7_9VIRU|nr:MAG: lipid membrane protein [Pithovirus LCPAC403]